MDEQVLKLRDLLGIIRRHLPLFLVLTLAGLAIGLAYAVVRPPMPAASSIVLLPPSSTTASGQPTVDVATEIEIAESEPVLDVAARNARLVLSYPVLQRRVAVSALTPDALQITARASSGRLAENLANAVAASFIQYSTSSALQSNQSLLELEQQYVQLGRELTTIQQQVNSTSNLLASETPGSAAAKSTQQLLTSLQVSQDNVSLEREVVSSQISQAKLSSPGSATGIVVLQRATTTLPRSVERIPMLGGLGALCGLVIAAMVAFTFERRDRRLRRRDDIASAAKAPVLQSLSTHCPKTAEDSGEFLRTLATQRHRTLLFAQGHGGSRHSEQETDRSNELPHASTNSKDAPRPATAAISAVRPHCGHAGRRPSRSERGSRVGGVRHNLRPLGDTRSRFRAQVGRRLKDGVRGARPRSKRPQPGPAHL